MRLERLQTAPPWGIWAFVIVCGFVWSGLGLPLNFLAGVIAATVGGAWSVNKGGDAALDCA
jgi:hypothetical protein